MFLLVETMASLAVTLSCSDYWMSSIEMVAAAVIRCWNCLLYQGDLVLTATRK